MISPRPETIEKCGECGDPQKKEYECKGCGDTLIGRVGVAGTPSNDDGIAYIMTCRRGYGMSMGYAVCEDCFESKTPAEMGFTGGEP